MERDRHRVAADIIIEESGEVVLIKRGAEPFRGTWSLPGGHVEEGEQVEEAAVREAREETGLEVEVEHVLGIYDEPGRDPRGPVISVAYVCRPVGGELEADTDAEKAHWFELDDLPGELGFDHRKILDDFRDKKDGF
ncbi:MAG: NUDIX hydrolase [Candidatus Nanohaloarchaea archaeon]|nr:NUDIX hydrolase [Candidatus Nanohaloarchaea archaeon]